MRVATRTKVVCFSLVVLTIAASSEYRVNGDGRINDHFGIPDVHQNATQHQLLTMLKSEKHEDRRAAYFEIRRRYRDLTAELRSIAATEKNKYHYTDERYLAVDLLAEFGCREAIPLFVKHIDYAQSRFFTEISMLNGYPCALALRKVGHGSTPHIFEFLRVPEPDPILAQERVARGLPPIISASDKHIELFSWLLLDLYGHHEGGSAEAIRVVRGARDRARRKENFDRLLTMLETVSDPEKRVEYIHKKWREAKNKAKK